jgi:hypothetical protein
MPHAIHPALVVALISLSTACAEAAPKAGWFSVASGALEFDASSISSRPDGKLTVSVRQKRAGADSILSEELVFRVDCSHKRVQLIPNPRDTAATAILPRDQPFSDYPSAVFDEFCARVAAR